MRFKLCQQTLEKFYGSKFLNWGFSSSFIFNITYFNITYETNYNSMFVRRKKYYHQFYLICG